MDPLPAAGVALAGGFLSGSIPFAWIAVRLRKGIDLRTQGSGNVGATNAARFLGRGWFPVIFALDFAKGALPVLAAGAVLSGGGGEDMAWAPAAAGVGAILGHVFPPWLGFRGGKGVATGAGAAFGLAPLACAAGLAGFALAAGLFRFVSLGSAVGAIAGIAAHLLFPGDATAAERRPATVFLTVLCAFVLVKHVPNFRRIAAGTEPRIFAKPAAAGEAAREE
jgi:glycerol-3-phosphate acyltransferase PlsY